MNGVVAVLSSPCEQTFGLFPGVLFLWLRTFQLVLPRTVPVSGTAGLTRMHLFIRIAKVLSKVHGCRFAPTSGSLNASCATFSPTFGPIGQPFKVFYRKWMKLPIHVLDHRACYGSFDRVASPSRSSQVLPTGLA